jgi:hypothetical protein
MYAYQWCSSPVRVRYLADVMNSDFLEMVDPTELYSVLAHPMQPYKARDFRSKPIHTTRTLAPVKYYLIDFGHSKKFDLSVPPEERLVRPRWGAGDKSIPEGRTLRPICC